MHVVILKSSIYEWLLPLKMYSQKPFQCQTNFELFGMSLFLEVVIDIKVVFFKKLFMEIWNYKIFYLIWLGWNELKKKDVWQDGLTEILTLYLNLGMRSYLSYF